ncbi:Artemisinic aldehyde Delta(11(13)) reductase [Favolaschia claudopus]|uniref:Artemisinic aldehyde Delta(11(13)) reductase n=1 Tax=Favolaschia claudopus TaxID=2862362 RepID=A0AAW0CHB9_9AGAR
MAQSALFTPLQVGSTTIQNRIVMAALTRNRSSASIPNDLMREYYLQRAKGGAGLIVTEGILVSRQGSEWQNASGIWNQPQIDGWKKIVDAVHGAGSKIYAQRSDFSQLAHVGRAAHPQAPEQIKAGVPVYAPSAIPARGGKFRFIEGQPGYVTPIEIPDPAYFINLFKQAAMNAKEAGFDGVELHAANGYLLNQFLDSSSNKRTDKWGGSPANRCRFVLELLKAMQEVWSENVAIKISPAVGYNDMGMPLEETIETFGYLLTEADKLGLAYVVLARYTELLDPEYDGKRNATPHDVLSTYAPFLKANNTPIFINVGVTPSEAECLLSTGKVAAVQWGMLWLTHPDLARRLREGKPLDNLLDGLHIYGAEGVDDRIGYTDYEEARY